MGENEVDERRDSQFELHKEILMDGFRNYKHGSISKLNLNYR